MRSIFNNISVDPDSGTAARTGICAASWVVTDPDGIQKTYSTLSSISFTTPKRGEWTVQLTATDNEGMTATTTSSFVAGTLQSHDAGNTDMCTGGDSKTNCGINPRSGNAACWFNDPVATRGHPLANNLVINSQGNFRDVALPAGNFKFTYGMFIAPAIPTDGSDPGEYHLFLVDGDGSEIDLGRTPGTISPPANMFSEFTETSSGYTLSNAGAPGNLRSRGNFTFTFNTSGKLLSLTDPRGNEQSVTYNTDDTPASVTDLSTGRTLTFEYDTPGLISRFVENGGGAVTHLAYDGSSRVTSITLKDSVGTTVRSVSLSYHPDGRLHQITRDGDSTTTRTFSYKKSNNDVYVGNMSWTGGGTNYTYWGAPYSGTAYRTVSTNSNGGVSYFDYDAHYNLIRVTRPKMNGATTGAVYTMSYDSNDNVVSRSDGAVTYTYTYNGNGLQTRAENSLGHFIKRTFSGADLTKVEDNLGTIVEYQYTDSSQPHVPTAVIDGLGNAWNYTLNGYGQVTQVTPPSGSPEGVTVYSYDESSASPTLGLLSQVINGNNEPTVIGGYTPLGDITSIETFPSSSSTNSFSMSYDAAQRVTGISYSDGKSIDYTYSGRDLTAATDEAGTTVNYSYCPTCGHLTGQSEPLGRTLSWSLDADLDETSFTDPRSNVTNYVYGTAKELKEVQYPDGLKRTYTYDNYGRLKTFKVLNFYNGTLSYDGAGNLAGINWGSGNTDNITYTYRADRLLSTASGRNGAAVVSYTYTAARQVESVTHNYSGEGLTAIQVLEYTYYPDGKLNTITWKNAGTTVATWSYTYDSAGRVASVSNSFGESATYTYDGEGKLLTQTNGNGTSTTYSYYEPRGWVASLVQNPTLSDH